jgi:hypothetical protein
LRLNPESIPITYLDRIQGLLLAYLFEVKDWSVFISKYCG